MHAPVVQAPALRRSRDWGLRVGSLGPCRPPGPASPPRTLPFVLRSAGFAAFSGGTCLARWPLPHDARGASVTSQGVCGRTCARRRFPVPFERGRVPACSSWSGFGPSLPLSLLVHRPDAGVKGCSPLGGRGSVDPLRWKGLTPRSGPGSSLPCGWRTVPAPGFAECSPRTSVAGRLAWAARL